MNCPQCNAPGFGDTTIIEPDETIYNYCSSCGLVQTTPTGRYDPKHVFKDESDRYAFWGVDWGNVRGGVNMPSGIGDMNSPFTGRLEELRRKLQIEIIKAMHEEYMRGHPRT